MLNDKLRRELNAVLPMLGEYLTGGNENALDLCYGLLERTLTPSRIMEKVIVICAEHVSTDTNGSSLITISMAQRLIEKVEVLEFSRLNTFGRA